MSVPYAYDDHVRLRLCPKPRATGRYAHRLWVCDICGLAYRTTTQPQPGLAPTAFSWSWVLWPNVTPSAEYPNGLEYVR